MGTRIYRYLGLAVLIGSGCAVTPDISTAERAIKGGYADYETTGVLGLVSFGNQGFGTCSGTLISPNVVLTARHCISPTLNQVQGGVSCAQTSFGNPYPAQSLYVTSRQQLSQNPNDYTGVWEVVIPPNGSMFCGNDMALLILGSPIDASLALPVIPRVDSSLESGEVYAAVGYGAVNDQGQGSGMRRRRDGLSVNCIGPLCAFMAAEDTEWAGEKGVCQGDSGGPAIDEHHRVVGVASRGASGCNYPIYGSVFSWGEWIKDVTVYAAQKAGIKPPQWATGWPTHPRYSYPVGSSCGADDQCLSGVCYDGYCTRQCLDSAPCPEGFTCEAGSGFCVLADVGTPCADDAGCPGGSCLEGRCTRPCTQTGTMDCPDGYICDATTWVCSLMPVSGACTVDEDCSTRQCVDGLCTRPCNELAPCPEGTLCDDSGVCALPPMGDTCESAEGCTSGLCLDGVCSRICFDDAQCIAGFYCSPEEGICESIPVGDVCTSDSDCPAGQCSEGICTRGCATDILACPDGTTCGAAGLCVILPPQTSGGCQVSRAQPFWLIALFLLLGVAYSRRREAPSAFV